MADVQFTPAQQAAITTPCGPILVSAAAGSGKTMVLVQRLMARVCDANDPCNIDDFLIITYTKKAASELRVKISEELSKRLAAQPENLHLQRQLSRIYLARISTIHSFCGELLREHAYRLDIPADFRIAEQDECAVMRANVVAELLEDRYKTISEDEDLRTLIGWLGAGRSDRAIEQLIVDVYLTSQCHPDPLGWLSECVQGLDVTDCSGAEQTVWGRFLMDSFRDLLAKQEELLRRMLQTILAEPSLLKYVGVYEEALSLIARLKGPDGWDGLCEALSDGLGVSRLPVVRNCPVPELQDRVKKLRNSSIDAIKDCASWFYAPSETVFADLRQTASAMRGLLSLVRGFTEGYAAEKQRAHALDYNDLEHGALRLLVGRSGGGPTQAARELSARFREIMIDEYQDTNEVQDLIFAAISQRGVNRFMVGDVKQSIYRFRLADPSIFLEKYRSYAPNDEAVPGEARKILLTENFRSEAPILEAVNAVFRANMSEEVGGLDYGDSEALRKGVPSEEPAPQVELHCIDLPSDPDEETVKKNRAEAVFIAKRVRELLREPAPDGTLLEPKDVVILLRSVKGTAEVYLEELQRLGIPCEGDREESFFEGEEIETLISLLQVLDNMHQDIPLASVLLSPVFAISAETLAKARVLCGGGDLAQAVLAAARTIPALAQALNVLDRLREQAALLPLHSLIEQIHSLTGFEAVYACMSDGDTRVRRLRQFAALAATFEDGGRRSLHQFLLRLEIWQLRGIDAAQESSLNAVRVTTIHKTKGLEFPVVFLANLSKTFNTEGLRAQVLFDEQLGVGTRVYQKELHASYPSIAWLAIRQRQAWEQLSEELRVLYVGMTRPRRRLIMTYCIKNLKTRLDRIASGLTVPLDPFFVRQQQSMGDWVLAAALLRTEAGALFELIGRQTPSSVQASPWRIELHTASPVPDASPARLPEEQARVSCPEPELLAGAMRGKYPHTGASLTPSKITATQLKGRELDEEAADRLPQKSPVRLRKPLLRHEQRPLTAAEKGIATHLAMQYLDFSRTDSLSSLAAELERLTQQQFLTPQQAEAVSPQKLFAVFSGPLGAMLRDADRVVREFKFSMLSDAADYGFDAPGERMLLQGVTDCFLIKDGRITVIDFKTDRVSPGQEAAAAAQYRSQLEAYSTALERICGLPVERKLLWFFSTDTMVTL